ncbi:MAG: sialidase family protein, partial [Mucilaginibacter sp.]
MRYLSCNLFLFSLFIISCSSGGTAADAQKKPVSQFSRAGLCDFLIDKSGVYHAVFQESPAIGKPTFIYYASSTDKGTSWSKPITLSNDNHGNGSGHARILQDGKGAIYAIWKRYGNTASEYPVPDALLDGPGGGISGTIFYKVLSGGQWSAPIQLNELEQTQESWFATVAPSGLVFIIWAQDNPATLPYSRQNWKYADYMRGASLIGTTHSAYFDLTKPIQPGGPGLSFPARQEGKIDLDGYIDKTGVLHLIYDFVDEKDVERIAYVVGNSSVVAY